MNTPTLTFTHLRFTLLAHTQVNLQGGVSVTFAPYNLCSPPNVNAGPDKPLDFVNLTTLTGSSTTPTPG